MKTKTLSSALIATASAFAVNYTVADEPVWDGNKVVLVSEKLGDGVFAYFPSDAKELEKQGKPVATSGGFIVGEKGVLVIDTMLNQRLNAQVQNMVRAAVLRKSNR